MLNYALAGAISAFPTSLVCSPMERIKVLLQTQKEVAKHAEAGSNTGLRSVLRELRRGGIVSVYSGFGATLARDIPGSAIYFWAYEYFSNLISPGDQSKKSIGSVIISGGIAGVSMWGLVIVSLLLRFLALKSGELIASPITFYYLTLRLPSKQPIDVIKSRIQAAPVGTYSGMLDCARKIFIERGIAGFFQGIGPAVARAFIVSYVLLFANCKSTPISLLTHDIHIS